MELFVVGKHVAETTCGHVWEFQGIFESILKAEEACLNESYFVGPCELNQSIPDESREWPGAYYPKASQG